MNLEFNEENEYTIGGEIGNLKCSETYTVSRLLVGATQNSHIFLKAIDDNAGSMLGLSLKSEPYYGKNTDRSFATLTITPAISPKRQERIVNEFNVFMRKSREKYHSLFLNSFRESKGGMVRKRISFNLVYLVVRFLLDAHDSNP